MTIQEIPKITYKKWWHRFLPYYRKRIKLMNIFFQKEWREGMDKKFAQAVFEQMAYGEQPKPLSTSIEDLK